MAAVSALGTTNPSSSLPPSPAPLQAAAGSAGPLAARPRHPAGPSVQAGQQGQAQPSSTSVIPPMQPGKAC